MSNQSVSHRQHSMNILLSGLMLNLGQKSDFSNIQQDSQLIQRTTRNHQEPGKFVF